MQEPQTDTAEHLRASLISCLNVAEDALLLRADQAISSASQNRYFEVLGDLRNHRRPLIDAFVDGWRVAPEDAGTVEVPTDPMLRALQWLEGAGRAATPGLPLPLMPRFRYALGHALSRHAIRPEGRLALLNAIAAQQPDPRLGDHSAEADLPVAWLRVLSLAGLSQELEPSACLQAWQGQLKGQMSAADQSATARVQVFLAAWADFLQQSELPAAAVRVLLQLRAGLVAAWLLRPDWFSSSGCAKELLTDLTELLAGVEQVAASSLPMVHRTVDTLSRHPERLPGVWLEWHLERARRAQLRADWQASAVREAAQAAALRQAAAQVRAVYEQRLPGRRLPREALRMMGTGWSEVLTLGFLHPDDTTCMGRREAIRLLDELLKSVSAETSKEERQSLMDALPGLMRSLRNGLEQTGMKTPQVNDLLHGLRDAHQALVFGKSDASRLNWEVVDADWMSENFPVPKTDGQVLPESIRPACAVGRWIRFDDAGLNGLHAFRVEFLDAERDVVGLGNELHVVFESLPLSRLAQRIEAGEAAPLRIDLQSAAHFAATLCAS